MLAPDHLSFEFLLGLEIPKALRLRYCVSLACIAPDLAPPEVGPDFCRSVAERAARRLRVTDVVATLSEGAVALLLIDADPYALPQILCRVTEELSVDPVRSLGREWRPTWSVGSGCYPKTASDRAELLRQAVGLMMRAKKDGGNRSYIAGVEPFVPMS